MTMIAIKEMEMPSCCMNCNMFRVLDGQARPQCAITETYIDDSDEYLDKRADDCPLVEIVTCKDCKHNCKNICGVDGSRVTDNFHCAGGEREE